MPLGSAGAHSSEMTESAPLPPFQGLPRPPATSRGGAEVEGLCLCPPQPPFQVRAPCGEALLASVHLWPGAVTVTPRKGPPD